MASERTSHDIDAWMQTAADAAAWTFRRPACADREALECLQSMRAKSRFLYVHGRSDLALLSRAQGLIAGSHSLPWAGLAARLRERHAAMSSSESSSPIALGAAVHNAQEIDAARRAQASFLVLGPIWQTPSKRGILEPQGCKPLRALAANPLPVIAIGGIDRPERVQQAHAAGAHAVMVLRAAQDRQRLDDLLGAWREAEAQNSSTVRAPTRPA